MRVVTNLRDAPLIGLYLLAFLLMGGFVTVYNYLAFRLVAEPYLLPAWAVGLTFLALAGTVSAPRAGMLAVRFGRYPVLVATAWRMTAEPNGFHGCVGGQRRGVIALPAELRQRLHLDEHVAV